MSRTLPLLALAACTATAGPVAVDRGFELPATWQAPGAVQGTVEDLWWTRFGDPGLEAAVDRALAHNHDLAAAAARLEAALAQARIAGADLYPQLEASINGRRNRQIFIGFPFPGGSSVPSTTFTSYGASLNLSWELDLWGRVRAGQAAAGADLESAAADLHGARLSLVAQVAKAWYAAVETELQRALAERTVASNRATLVQVRRLYETGARPPLDLRQARANVAAAEATLDQRLAQRERTLRQVQILLGAYPDGALATTPDLPRNLPPVPGGLPTELLRRRPDLVAAERRLAASGARLDQARASLYPQLSLTASGGTASDALGDLLDDSFRVWSLAGNLLQPLFQGGRLRADVARNEALVREAAADFSSALLRALFEVETALAVRAHLERQVRSRQGAAEESQAAHDLALERYQLGLTDFLAVADAQRQSMVQESLWLTSRRQRLNAIIDLHLALGGGFAAPSEPPSAEEQTP